MTVAVARQADGSVRVQFDAKGPTQRDPGLGNRFSQACERRMGRKAGRIPTTTGGRR